MLARDTVIAVYVYVGYRLTVPIFQAISYEYTVEMTYPVPEATSASVLNAFSQVSL